MQPKRATAVIHFPDVEVRVREDPGRCKDQGSNAIDESERWLLTMGVEQSKLD